MSQPEVLITGVGCVSPNGVGTTSFFNNTLLGKSGITNIDRFDSDGLDCRVAGTVDNFEVSDWIDESDQKDLSRSIAFADAASTEALLDAQLENMPHPDQTAVILGSGGGPIDFTEDQYRWYFTGEGSPSVYNVPSSTIGNLASEISIRKQITGPSHLISTGCTSSSDALGHALMLLRSGRAQSVVCGGVDSPVTPAVIGGFEKMRVIATGWNDSPKKASRPFENRRNGFVLGEGSWIVILETENHLRSRSGPDPIARLSGYGSTCDAHHRVRMKEDGTKGPKAIKKTLQDADKRPEDVDFIQAHGTSTELNDRVETTIFNETFDDPPPVSSIKSMIGHPQGASGAAGVVAGLIALRTQHLPPTINYQQPDEDCDVFCVPNEPIAHETSTVLVNCLGFGSRNSSILLEQP